MARARNLKPSFFLNDELATIDPLGRILFQGLWCLADRAGRLEDRPRRIKAEVLPYDECNVDELLETLDAKGFILRYESGDSRYIQVVNFEKHQNPHIKEAPSTIPEPCEHETSTVQVLEMHEASPADSPFPLTDSGSLTAEEERASAPPPPNKPSPVAFEIAETLKQAPWVGDDLDIVAAKVDESAAKASWFDLARDGPLLALSYVNCKKYRKQPPVLWYSAWLNWLRKERDDAERTPNRARSTDRRGGHDPASQIGRDPADTSADDAYYDGPFRRPTGATEADQRRHRTDSGPHRGDSLAAAGGT